MSGVELYLLVLVDGLKVLVELLTDLTGVLAEVGLGVVLQALLVELALEVLEGKSIAINPSLDLEPTTCFSCDLLQDGNITTGKGVVVGLLLERGAQDGSGGRGREDDG